MSDALRDEEQFETEELQGVFYGEDMIDEDALVEFDYENVGCVDRYKVIEKEYFDRTEKQIHRYDDHGHHRPAWVRETNIRDDKYRDQDLIRAAEEALESTD